MSAPLVYADRMQSHARRAAAETGLPVATILAQWGNESGWGTSALARNHNNHGGIKWVGAATQDYQVPGRAFAGYRSAERFVDDYVRVIRLPFYTPVRQAAALDYPDAQARALAVARFLGQSPYDEGRYTADGVPGKKLTDILHAVPLTRFENVPVARTWVLPGVEVIQRAPGRVEVASAAAVEAWGGVAGFLVLAGLALALIAPGDGGAE